MAAILDKDYAPPTSGKLAGLKKGMPAISGTIFRANTRRGTDNAETLHAILFDFDNAQEEPSGEFWDEGRTRPKMTKVRSRVVADPDCVCDHLKGRNITFRAYTTWSSTPEWVKFRVVVPLKSALTPEVWSAAVEKAIQDLGLDQWREGIDIKVVRDTARLHFLPNIGAIHWGHDGDFLWIDPEGLDRISLPPLPKNEYARPRAEDQDWAQFGILVPSLQLSDLLETLGCNLSKPRSLDDGGVKRRTTCPWGREHSHGPDGDDAVVIETPGKWPVFQCAHSGHAHMSLYEILLLAREQKIDLTDYAKKYSEDLEERIEKITEETTDESLRGVLGELIKMPQLMQERLLKRVKAKSGASMALLRSMIHKMQRETNLPEAGQTVDLGRRIAETMLDRYYAGGKHLIQALDKSWWTYTGSHWRRLSNDNAIRHYLLETIKSEGAGDQQESAVIESSYRILCAMAAVEQDLLRLAGDQPRVVNCRNGELWIDNHGNVDLRPHRAESYLTYVLDQDYDPKAICPTWEKALLDTFALSTSPEEMVRNFQELFGYIIQPRRDQKMWVIGQGCGDNGKTKTMQTLQKLMNVRCVFASRITAVDKDQFSKAALAGKLLLIDDDVDTNTVLPDGLLKQISEDKLLSARNLYREPFEFRSTVVPVLLCNNFPSCRDLTPATQARVMAIPFARVFNRAVDPNPYPLIWEKELSGVLNWALAGYKRLMARGHFLEPEDCARTKQEFLAAANPLVSFVQTACDKGAPNWAPSMEVYRAFAGWCAVEGHRYVPKKSEVERDLVSLGFKLDMDLHLKQKIVRGLRPIPVTEGVTV